MEQWYIKGLKSKAQALSDFLMQNEPAYEKDRMTGKVRMVRPPANGKEYTPELQAQVEKAKKDLQDIYDQVNVAETALQLKAHRSAEEVVKNNPILFHNAETMEEIDADKIDADIKTLYARDNELHDFKVQISIQEKRCAGAVKAKKELSQVLHSNDEMMQYLNGLDPNIVRQIYAKKQAFVQAVKESHQMNQALEVKPKGLLPRIKFALTRGKREKESKAATQRVYDMRSEIIELARQLPTPDSMRCCMA